jgi:predicted ATPase
LWIPIIFARLATACEIVGQVDEGGTLLDEALQIVGRTGERWLAAELNRHKGQLLLRREHSEAAEELYRKALGIAAEQGAKLWELRAAARLARLRCREGAIHPIKPGQDEIVRRFFFRLARGRLWTRFPG